jgi:3'-5' exoribonuclease
MARRFVNQLGHQEAVNEVFRAAEKQLRPNRNGNLYLQLELSDRTGTISARMWNATDAAYRAFENGDFVRVEGSTQLYQGAMQLIAARITRAAPADVKEDDFAPLPSGAVDRLAVRLGELVRELTEPHLRALGECILVDNEMMGKLMRAPAGVKNHHAYPGGLLEHMVSLMEVVLRIAPCYPQINRDLLLMGAMVHDIGKVDELLYERELAYSDEGQLIGHLVMAVGMIERKAAEVEKLIGEPFPKETLLRLKHMIVSHHGEYEYGSPKLPMTIEAIALYCLDNLDAKVFSFRQQLRDDPNIDSAWTHFNPNLGRKLFKGSHGDARE